MSNISIHLLNADLVSFIVEGSENIKLGIFNPKTMSIKTVDKLNEYPLKNVTWIKTARAYDFIPVNNVAVVHYDEIGAVYYTDTQGSVLEDYKN